MRSLFKQTKFKYMAKIYSKKTLVISTMKPKKETISFLLNYSKALTVISAGGMLIETIAN